MTFRVIIEVGGRKHARRVRARDRAHAEQQAGVVARVLASRVSDMEAAVRRAVCKESADAHQ